MRFVHGASVTAPHRVAESYDDCAAGALGGLGARPAGDGRLLNVGQVTGTGAGAFAPVASFGVTVRANG
ncbi:hypothetical protein ACFVDQ_23860 [Streptomyces sp. NPDC057684]|uniref:hypothetical protein n=1 Tax=Streptomyces sp. NPDC057684 TaxID=3346211 RepID=UPI00369616DE